MLHDQIQQRADGIIELLRKQPEQGADLLIDFAQKYGSETQIEDDAIIAKVHWTLAENEQEKQKAIRELEAIAQQIVKHFDPHVLAERQAKEAALTEAAAKLEVPNDVVLRAEQIKKQYPSSKFSLNLDHLELRLGEITGLVGENATGKTTLFRILAGDLAADRGKLNYPLFTHDNKIFWAKFKTKIAYVPQELPIWQGSLVENLKYEAAVHNLKGEANQRAVDYIIQRLGLATHLEKSWMELSGGYKLRFSLAKALVWNAQLLIIDEPLAFLDVKTQLIVLNDLKNLANNLRQPLSILISSQHIHEIEAVADQMLFMRSGEVEYLGRSLEWGKGRKVNVFELGVAQDFKNFHEQLKDFPHDKIWSNGMNYFVSTRLETSAQDILQFLTAKQIPLNYFRDISRSVKTKFYEEHL